MRSTFALLVCWSALSLGAEPFTFQPESKTAQRKPPTWWSVAAAPDGQTLLTTHQQGDRGELWVWDAVRGQVTATLTEPQGIRCVAFAPKGDYFATGNFDQQVRIYDANTKQLRAIGKGHTGGINGLSFSGDGQLLATAGLDLQIRVWDMQALATAKDVVTLETRNILTGHTEGVLCVAFAPDGKRLLSGSFDRSARLWLLPPAGAKATQEEQLLTGHTAAVESVAWSPKGNRMATGSWDNTALLWDAEGKSIGRLRGHTRGVLALTFSPDGQTLVTASGDENSPAAGELRLWGAERGTDLGQLGKHDDMIRGLAFVGSNRRLVSMGRDRTLRVWNVGTKLEEQVFRTRDDQQPVQPIITAIAYAPDGKTLAHADDTGAIHLQELPARKALGRWQAHQGTIHSLTWTPNGQQLVSASADRTVIVWDVRKQQALHTLKHPSVVYALALSPDGTTLATGGFDKTVRLFNIATGAAQGQRTGHTASVRALAFAPSGKRFASGGSDFTLHVWSTSDERSTEFRGHSRAVRGVAFTDENTFLSVSDDRTVKRWSTTDAENTLTVGPLNEQAIALTLAPQRSFAVVGFADGGVHVYDANDLQRRVSLTGATDGVPAVAIAPDGREITAGGYDRTLRWWHAIDTRPPLGVGYVGHKGAVRTVAVASDGEQVITGGDDGTLRLWEAHTGKERHQWLAHEGGVRRVVWSRDGRWLLSCGNDQQAKLWTAATRQLVRTFSKTHRDAVGISASGSLIVLGEEGNRFAWYDREQPEKLGSHALDGPVARFQFLGDDYLILTTTKAQAQFWSVKERRLLKDLNSGRYSRVHGATASQDGVTILIAGREQQTPTTKGPIRTDEVLHLGYDIPGRNDALQTLLKGSDEVAHLTIADDGNIFVAALGDGQVYVWEAMTPGQEPPKIRQFHAHASRIHDVAVSADGRYFVTVSADGTAQRWNGRRGEPLVYAAKLLDEAQQTWFARIAPTGMLLVTGGDDGVVRVRRGVPGAYHTLPGDYTATYSTVVAPDGSWLASGHHDGVIRVWDRKTRTERLKDDQHTHRVWGLAVNHDGSRLISVGGDWNNTIPGEIRVWDTATWKVLHRVAGHADLIFSVAIAPDGKTFATASRDRTIRTWDMVTAKEVGVLNGHTAAVRSVQYAKDGKWLISAGHDRRLLWWDVAKREQLGSRQWEGSALEKIRIAPDGRTVAVTIRTGSNRGFIALWDMDTDRITHEIRGHMGQVNDVAFSPDGQTLVSVGGVYGSDSYVERGAIGPYVQRSGTTTPGAVRPKIPTAEIKLWDAKSGKPIAELPGHREWVECVQFTPDGTTLITAGGIQDRPGEIRLWHADALRPSLTLQAHRGRVTSAAFNPDGTRLVTGGDGQLFLWDMAKAHTGVVPKPTLLLQELIGLVRHVQFTPDGKHIVSAGDDGNVRMWNSDGTLARTIKAHAMPIYGFAINTEGTQLATAAGDFRNNKHGEVRVWDIAQGTELLRLPDQPASAWSVAFTRTGQLVTGQQGNIPVKVYDMKTKQVVHTLAFPDDLRSLGTVRERSWLAGVGGRQGVLKIWDQRTWHEAYEVPAHPGKVAFMVDFSTDGLTLATAGGDAAAVLWQIPRPGWRIPKPYTVIPQPPAP